MIIINNLKLKTKIVSVFLLAQSTLVSAQGTNSSIKKISLKDKYIDSIGLNYSFEQIENIDGLANFSTIGNIDNITEDTRLDKIQGDVKLKLFRNSKWRVRGKSSVGGTFAQENPTLSGRGDVFNRDNANLSNRSVDFSQSLDARYKLKRGSYIFFDLKGKYHEGYFVEKNFDQNDGNYYIIRDDKLQYSTSLGFKTKLGKGFSIFPKYQFEISDYKYDYSSFDATAGNQNDNLKHIGGLAMFYKVNKQVKLRLINQYSKIYYRNKLALDSTGLFPAAGLASPETLEDLSFEAGVSAKSGGFNFDIQNTLKVRKDEVSGARDSIRNAVRVKVGMKAGAFKISTSNSFSRQNYENQFADFIGTSEDKRRINTFTNEVKLSYKVVNYTPEFSVQNINKDTNRDLDNTDSTNFTLALKTRF